MGRGVLLDMDGVLVATEELKALAHSRALAEYGGELDENVYKKVMGSRQADAERAFIEASGADIDLDEYSQTFRGIYVELLRTRLSLTPGGADLVKALHAEHYRLALVSSSLGWMMQEVLSRTGMVSFFSAIVSADDVEEEKPSPQPYLRALSLLSLEPASAVVIEDTESGVKSGVDAGMKVIALRHEYNVLHDFSGAFAVLDTLEERDEVLKAIDAALLPA